MFTVLVAVPEAAVDVDDGPVFGQDDVGAAGKLVIERAVHGEAKPVAMEQGAQKAFGFGVLSRDPGHDPTPLFPVKDIRHLLGSYHASSLSSGRDHRTSTPSSSAKDPARLNWNKSSPPPSTRSTGPADPEPQAPPASRLNLSYLIAI